MEANADKSSSYIDFFRTKGNRWRLAIIISLGVISQYSGNALFSNYIDRVYDGAGIKEENKKLGVSFPSRHCLGLLMNFCLHNTYLLIALGWQDNHGSHNCRRCRPDRR